MPNLVLTIAAWMGLSAGVYGLMSLFRSDESLMSNTPVSATEKRIITAISAMWTLLISGRVLGWW